MAKVLSQLSTFLRFGPIPSHNLSGQLLQAGGKGYSSLCLHYYWDFKKMQLAKPSFGEKNIIFKIKQFNKN